MFVFVLVYGRIFVGLVFWAGFGWWILVLVGLVVLFCLRFSGCGYRFWFPGMLWFGGLISFGLR